MVPRGHQISGGTESLGVPNHCDTGMMDVGSGDKDLLYNFLQYYDLGGYYEEFVKKGVLKASHLKDVSDADLIEIGLSGPERTRLQKKVEKNFFSATAKLKNKLYSKGKKKFASLDKQDAAVPVAFATQAREKAYDRLIVEIPCLDEVVTMVLLAQKGTLLKEVMSLAKKHQVTVTIDTKPLVSVKVGGSQHGREVVIPAVKEVFRSIEESIGTSVVEGPLLVAPFLSTEDYVQFLSMLRQRYHVVVDNATSSDTTSSDTTSSDTSSSDTTTDSLGNVNLQVGIYHPPKCQKGITVSIIKGDILNEEVDAIVTVANNELKDIHSLALVPGDAVLLDPGKLSFKKIIRAVGPSLNGDSNNEKSDQIALAFFNSLCLANQEGLSSIALPAIGTEMYSDSESVCASAAVHALSNFLTSNPKSTLTDVRFILFTSKAISAFQLYFPVEQTSPTVVPPSPVATPPVTISPSFFPKASVRSSTDSLTCTWNREDDIKKEAIRWLYKDDRGTFTLYQPHNSTQIEAWYQSRSPKSLTINNIQYTFDFDEMVQVNCQTQRKRDIQRKCIIIRTADTSKVTLFVRGPRTNLAHASAMLLSILQNSIRAEHLILGFSSRPLQALLLEVAHTHQIELEFGSSSGKTVVCLRGVSQFVLRAYVEMQKLVSDKTQFPGEWQPQSKTTELLPLIQGSAEWSRVAEKFVTTMNGIQIISIERVQNSWLWQRYAQHKEMMYQKNAGDVNEKELFHGTRGNKPLLIYDSEEGFDMRYSAQGLWGRANYFAVKASYSDKFAHTTASGQKQLFLAKVLTGNSHRCAPNSALRMPPEKTSSGQVQLSQVRYDTVTGYTSGFQVYMTYDNQKAYPAYLITYAKSKVSAAILPL